MDSSPELRADRSEMFLVWGWLLATLSVLLPLFAIGGLIFASTAVKRGRPGHGAGMVVVSVLGVMIWFVYLASQTLVPR